MDELFVTGTHLAQNRHPTRSPLPYFEEMLRRDPLDSRASTALAAARYRTGHYAQARDLLENALARLTRRNLNPPSGEASYRLGLVLERTGHLEEARERFGKAAWDRAWAHPAHLALARLALRSGDAAEALRRAASALATEAASPEAGHLSYLALERLGRQTESTRAAGGHPGGRPPGSGGAGPRRNPAGCGSQDRPGGGVLAGAGGAVAACP